MTDATPPTPPAWESLSLTAAASLGEDIVELTQPMVPATPSRPAVGNVLRRVERMLPSWTAQAYDEAPAAVRPRIIECLMRPVGVLGLVAVAGGAFAALRQRNGWEQLQVGLGDAVQVSTAQVFELASYVQQTAPDAFSQVADLFTTQPAGVGAAMLIQAVAMRPWAGRRRKAA